jgi:hypothetical protein
MEEWSYSPKHSVLDRDKWSASGPGRFTPRERKSLRCSLDRRLSGPQNRSGSAGKEINLSCESNPGSPVHSNSATSKSGQEATHLICIW